MDRLIVSAPLPPSSNNIYATGSDGKRHLTEKAKEYRKEIGWAMLDKGKHCPKPPFALHIHLRLPDRRRRDASNAVKLLEDSVFSGLPYDDSQVFDLHVWKYHAPNNPGVTLELRHTDRLLEAAV